MLKYEAFKDIDFEPVVEYDGDSYARAKVRFLEVLQSADIVLAEGFSHAPGAKIEILRAACARPPRCTPADGLVAMVSDRADAHPELPHFALDDCAALADFLLACPA